MAIETAPAAARLECPVCDDPRLVYQFRLPDASFARCRACDVLVAARGSRPSHATSEPGADAALEHAFALAERYRASPIERSLIVRDESPRARSDERFDAIFVCGALERSADPRAFLEGLTAHLAPAGVLAILAPSTTSRAARSQRVKWHALRSEARFYLSPDTVHLAATRGGIGEVLLYTDASGDRDASPELALWFRSNMLVLGRARERPRDRVLSVVMPVYNEVTTVERSIRRVLEKRIEGVEIELVIVENNSTDGSPSIVEAFRSHPRVTVLALDRPRGKGFAVRAGLQRVRGEVVLIQDADLEYDVEDYDRLVAPLFALERNFVLGSRHDAAGSNWNVRYFDSEPVLTKFLNVGHVMLVAIFNLLFEQRLSDPFTMYKVFRRDCLYGLSFQCDRFDFDLELVIKLIRKGYRAFEIPVNYRSRPFREGKKISIVRDPFDWMVAMIRFRRSVLFTKRS